MCRAQVDRNSVDWAVNSSSNQNYVGTKFSCLKYDLRCTYIEQTKPTILQCTCDQQRLGSVCASTHYIKERFLDSPESKEGAYCMISNGLIRMCCCIGTVYPALYSQAIEGKYDQRMLLSECAVALNDPSFYS